MIHLNIQSSGEINHRLGDFHADRQHHHVEAKLVRIAVFTLIIEYEIPRVWVFVQATGPATIVVDSVFVPRPLKIGPIPLGKSAHIHEKNIDVEPRIVLLGYHCFLGGIHAAHGGTIIVVLIAAANALQEGNSLRRPAIRWSLHVPLRGS